MKSFKQFIKPKFEKDSKGRYIIHHSNIGIEKIFHKNNKDEYVPPPNKTGIHEIYHELTNKDELNPVIPSSIKKLHDKLYKYYDLHNNTDAIDIAKRYSTSSYGTNSTLHDLHTGNIQTQHFPDSTKKIVYALDNLHNKTKQSPEDFHVYTGIKWNPTDLFKNTRSSPFDISGHKKDEGKDHVLIHLPAYTSTSLWAQKAQGFSRPDDNSNNHIIKIKIPKGSKHGVYIDGVSEFGTHRYDNAAEKEFLLKRGLTLKLSKTPEVHDGRVHVWHGEIVAHEPNQIDLIHPDATPEQLLGHSKSLNPHIKQAVALHKNITPELSKKLANDPDESIVTSVIKSKYTHPDVLHDILPNNLHLAKDFINNNNTSAKTIHDIVTKHFPNDIKIHERLAFHPKTEDKTFSHLVDKYKTHKNEYEQRQVLNRIANHKNASSSTLMKIAKINPKLYGNTIRNNLNAGDDVLDFIDKHDYD